MAKYNDIHNTLSLTETYPLSQGQEAYWFIHRFAPESSACRIGFLIHMYTELDVDALHNAFQSLVNRHPCLRTLFLLEEDGTPVQNAYGYKKVFFEHIDVSTLDGDQLQQKIHVAKEHPFHLEQGPLFRVSLFTHSQKEHTLLCIAHTIILDSPSLQIILSELPQLYTASKTSAEIPLPSISHFYADFVRIESKMAKSYEGKKSLDYWKKELDIDIPALNVPVDYPRPRIRSYNGKTYAFNIDEKLAGKLRVLAENEKISYADLFLAAFQVLLYRYTQQSIIITGVATDSRQKTECDGVVGYFADQMILRSNVSAKTNFRDFLKYVAERLQHGRTYHSCTFSSLVSALNKEQDLALSPVFQALFAWQEAMVSESPVILRETDPRADQSKSGWVLSEITQYEGLFDLVLDITKDRDSLICAFRYNSDLFRLDTISRMTDHLQILLKEIANNPAQPIGKLPLLTELEKQKFLVEINETKIEIPETCIHKWFTEQVKKTPEAIALIFSTGDSARNIGLTYTELNEKANQLAHYLQAKGVGSETLVGLCVERSLNMIIGILGILKAGGAYIPLDPAYPVQRLTYMLENSQVKVLLTQTNVVEKLPNFDGETVIFDMDIISQQSTENIETNSIPDSLACVIYTSGSTGKPKGVMITHLNLCNAVIRANDQFELLPGTRVVQFASFSFVMSVGDIFSSLCSGTTLYIGTREALMPGDPLTEFLSKNQIDVICMSASSLALLSPEKLQGVKNILVAGEPCPAEVMAKWVTERRFFIGYGMTELTGGATTKKCSVTDTIPLLGRPNPNISLYILDKERQLVPVGVSGELYIGGAGLTRGYLNHPKLTQEKFIPNPFTDRPGAMICQTGDRARYLANGEVEFLSRTDFQINIRGFRIEPGEVETILDQHPEVTRSVVVAKKDQAGNKRLVGYFVPKSGKMPTAGGLRDYLGDRLPDFMVPAIFVLLEKIPLTPNGKIDRLALPELTLDMIARPRSDYTMAENSIEQAIVTIFLEVLGIDRVGVNDNFFEIGADSLLLVRICDQLQTVFRLELPVVKLFEFPTIRLLGNSISKQVDSQKDESHDLNYHSDRKIINSQQNKKALIHTTHLIVLSALNEERLSVYSENLANFLKKKILTSDDQQRPVTLASLAYTLQIGRKAMNERLAFVASNISEATEKLAQYSTVKNDIPGLYTSHVKNRNTDFGLLLQGREGTEYKRIIIEDRNLDRLAQLWVSGTEIDWRLLYPKNTPHKIPLPTYPFAKQRYSIEPKKQVSGEIGLLAKPSMPSSQNQEVSVCTQLYFEGVWEKTELRHQIEANRIAGNILLFDKNSLIGDEIQKIFTSGQVILVKQGEAYEQKESNHYTINPTEQKDYQKLLRSLSRQGQLPELIIHFWSQEAFDPNGKKRLNSQLDRGLYSIFYLTKALMEEKQGTTPQTKILYAYKGSPEAPQPQYAALYGFANSLRLENSSFFCKTIEVGDYLSDSLSTLAKTLIHEFDNSDQQIRIRYTDQGRFVRGLREFFPEKEEGHELPLKKNGVYLITGGMGGLGLIFAQYLAKEYQAKLILTGRTALSPEKQIHLRTLEALGAEVIYLKRDVSHQEDAEALIKESKQKFKTINGIIHSAGVIRRGFIRETKEEDIRQILSPKVEGTLYLDEYLKEDKLDFFVLFSSISAEIESLGLPGYAFANGFLDHFAALREKLRANGKRTGKTLFINWPLWKEGGMQPGKQTEKILSQTLGMALLRTESGVNAFTRGLTFNQTGFLFVEGNPEKIRYALLGTKQRRIQTTLPNQETFKNKGKLVQEDKGILDKIQDDMIQIVATLLKKEQDSIDLNETLYTYGFDSLSLTEFAGQLNEKYQFSESLNPITPSIFFEHSTIASLSKYLLEDYTQEMTHIYKAQGQSASLDKHEFVQKDKGILNKIQDDLTQIITTLLKKEQDTIDLNETLYTYGFDSLSLTEFAGQLNEKYHFSESLNPITPSVFFEHSTIASLSKYLLADYAQEMTHIYRDQGQSASLDKREFVQEDKDILNKIQDDLIQIVATLLKKEQDTIDLNETLYTYGFDSLSLTEFAGQLNEKYHFSESLNPITPSVFFEHSTIASLSKYLLEDYTQEMTHFYAGFISKVQEIKTDFSSLPPLDEPLKFVSSMTTFSATQENQQAPIAIIGMSGMMPQSEDLATFWQHLVRGDNLVTEIPEDRWDWKAYYGDPDSEPNKTNVKWGGFLKHIEAFDPSFFAISPREAELMDPQQRLFLETTWKCIEDGGYKPSDLSGTKTGVFVGVSNSGYREMITRQGIPIESYMATGTATSVIPNRISYFLNLHGPSEPIDTACSSSLVAIHRAVTSIRQGECETAIAGGVNIILSPVNYIYLSKAGMLSPDGRCSTFDKQANGFVRGEGVAALLLKPLDKAIKDQDHIHGVIRATAVNHGGHANSLTAPNTAAQAELLITAYKNAELDPTTISYIEAHGTGTKLGDPVEINALKKGFAELYQQWGKPVPKVPSCGLGSVKTYTGHLEAAAGMAGIIKTVLSMKHKTLLRNLHFTETNPYIDLKNTPFYIVDKTEPWKVLKDEHGRELPRRAGVSSFGFGGANAHIVIEEFLGTTTGTQSPKVSLPNEEHIFVFSAKNDERLRAYARNMADFLKNTSPLKSKLIFNNESSTVLQENLSQIASDILKVDQKEIDFEGDLTEYGFEPVSLSSFSSELSKQYDIDIKIDVFFNYSSINALAQYLIQTYEDKLISHYPMMSHAPTAIEIHEVSCDINPAEIAYTLQIGRDTMEKRLAVVSTLEALSKKLAQYSEGKKNLSNVYTGSAIVNKEITGLLTENKAGNQFLKEIINQKELRKIASLWVAGMEIDWPLLYPYESQNRIPLPTYPFAQERYWIPENDGLKVSEIHSSSHMNFLHEEDRKDTGTYSTPVSSTHRNDKKDTLVPSSFDTILNYITHTIAATLKVESSKLDPDTHFESYGLDSILITQLYLALKKQFGEVSPTLLFTYKTINTLSEYFLEHHQEKINALTQQPSKIKGDELPSEQKIGTTIFGGEQLEPPLFSTVLDYITHTIAATLKTDPFKLDPDTHFESYGLDSILITQLYLELKKQFGEISPTLLFTYKTINTLSEYFLEHHQEKINALTQRSLKAKDNEKPLLSKQKICTAVVDDEKKIEDCNEVSQDIAIIGVSGKFPMADNIGEFWENLKAGKNCVTEIPKERWDYQQYPEMYCKWGGFLDDFDKFDTQFFNVSPNRARFMNPQERLFLQAAWSCIEDAGYTRKRLEDPEDSDRRGNVGVFAGVSFNEYQLHTMAEWEKGNRVPVNSQICSVANRVSYFMNLRGPSLSVDTACSASLYAIHLACESIRRKECEMAIAGGVNLSQHPAKYVTLCSIGMLSNKGRCNAFGQDGDGMVPGEAVGAVLLKPLSQAIRDGDIIYAAIKGTSVTHDGKTYGYTVPNPVAQTEVIKAAIDKSKIDPRTISYVEAHGTGTALGDPIEIEGLGNAYAGYTEDKQYCAIGSVKSNIGHSEAAAGIVQLIKVILQMKHKTLVPSLLDPGSELNSNINFDKTPFYVQQKVEEWKQPTLRKNNKTETLPRRAGISSWGASGVNVHLIAEEYPLGPETFGKNRGINQQTESDTVIIPLSAMKEESLKTYAENLKIFLEKTKDRDERLVIEDMAYSLQIGREPMLFRVAFVVKTTEELIDKLGRFLLKFANEATNSIFYGQKQNGKETHESVENILSKKELNKLAQRWVDGFNFDWETIYDLKTKPHRISLPSYPFLKQRFWITDLLPPSASNTRDSITIEPDTSAAIVQNVEAEDNLSNRNEATSFLLELADAPEKEQEEMISAVLQKKVSALLGFAPDYLPAVDEGFFAMGMESMQALALQAELEKTFQVKISDTAVFDYPDIRTFSVYLRELIPFDDLLVDNAEIETESLAHKPSGPLYEITDENLAYLYEGPLPDDILNMDIEEVEKNLEKLIQ